jgi:LAO/AO transport system kinase
MMKDKIAEEIKKKALNNRISCSVARKIARELSVSLKEVGSAANELKVKITDCELGCF